MEAAGLRVRRRGPASHPRGREADGLEVMGLLELGGGRLGRALDGFSPLRIVDRAGRLDRALDGFFGWPRIAWPLCDIDVNEALCPPDLATVAPEAPPPQRRPRADRRGKRLALRVLASSLVVLGVLIGRTPPAWGAASDARAAAQLANKARTLMARMQLEEACHLFEQSDERSPRVDTRFDLGVCREKQDDVLSAMREFRVVIDRAAAMPAPSSRVAALSSAARAHLETLKSRVSTILVRLSTTDGVWVNVDGRIVPIQSLQDPLELNPGSHEILVSAPGKKTWQTHLELLAGAKDEVHVPELESFDAPPRAALSQAMAVGETSVVAALPSADQAAAASPSAQGAPASNPWTVGLGSTFVLPSRGSDDAFANVTAVSASRALPERWSAYARVPVVGFYAQGRASTVFMANPVLGATRGYTLASGLTLRIGGQTTIPLGQGGDSMSPTIREAVSTLRGAGPSVNYVVFGPTGSITYAMSHVSATATSTLAQFVRVRGEHIEKDALRTQYSGTISAGLSPFADVSKTPIAAFTELRYRIWLTDVASARSDPRARDHLAAAVGFRVRVPLGGAVGSAAFAYSTALDAPLADFGFRTIEADAQIAF